MSRNKKIIIVIAVILIIGAVCYFVFRKPKAVEPVVIVPTPGSGPGAINVSTPVETFPLGSGSKGENTKRLQRAMNRLKPENKISEDGIWGPATTLKLQSQFATNYYTYGPKVTEAQLNNFISMANAV